jgi:hypothetical protein
MKTKIAAVVVATGMALGVVGGASAYTLVSTQTYSVPSAVYCPATDLGYFTQVYNVDSGICTRSYFR